MLYFVYHLSMDTGAASTFGLLWIMLLWTWVYKYLFETLLSILLGVHPELELLDHMVILWLIFEEPQYCFYKGCIILYSHQQCARVPVSHHPCQHLLFCLLTCLLVGSSHPNGYEVLSYCGFDWGHFKVLAKFSEVFGLFMDTHWLKHDGLGRRRGERVREPQLAADFVLVIYLPGVYWDPLFLRLGLGGPLWKTENKYSLCRPGAHSPVASERLNPQV